MELGFRWEALNGNFSNVLLGITFKPEPFRAHEQFQKRDPSRGFVELLNDLELALLNNAEELACLL